MKDAACGTGDEVVPEPREDEFVVFPAHFTYGFGFPTSTFFRWFLMFSVCSHTISAPTQSLQKKHIRDILGRTNFFSIMLTTLL